MNAQKSTEAFPSTASILAIAGACFMIVAGLLVLAVSAFIIPHLNNSFFNGTMNFNNTGHPIPIHNIPGFVRRYPGRGGPVRAHLRPRRARLRHHGKDPSGAVHSLRGPHSHLLRPELLRVGRVRHRGYTGHHRRHHDPQVETAACTRSSRRPPEPVSSDGRNRSGLIG